MSETSIKNSESDDFNKNPKGVVIDFNKIENISFEGKNISDSTLTGHINKKHLFNKINIIHSVIKNAHAYEVDFHNGDIKDCAIKESIIEICNFNEAAHINNDVSNINFIKCSFNQTSITDSEYRDTIFIECDFTNVIISSSKFINCKFIRCITSNKFIESSLIFDCDFEETDIQAETIIENFGINKNNLINSKIIVENKDKGRVLITPDEFTFNSISLKLNEIELFIIDYFHTPTILIEGSSNIDSTFEYTNWLKLSKNPNRFRLLIERYHEFILFNYDKDQAPFWMILKLHKMTEELSNSIDSSRVDIYRSIMGVHMSLSRLVEVYLQLCEVLLIKYLKEKEINFLVEKGPIDPTYYYNELEPIFEGRTLSIKKIIKHNSPNELLLIWDNYRDLLSLVAIFLATRVKFGIQKLILSENLLTTTKEGSNQIERYSSKKDISAIDIIKTEFGFDNYANNYILKIKAILPGNLLLHLNIEFRTKVFGKVKKIMLDILSKSTTKV
jgi:uncharacterized protein YjbI with pentapeptide repeats